MQGARGGERRVSGNHAINRGPSYPDQNQAPRLPNLAIVLRSTYSYLRVQVERYGTISSIPSTIFLNALRPFITPPPSRLFYAPGVHPCVIPCGGLGWGKLYPRSTSLERLTLTYENSKSCLSTTPLSRISPLLPLYIITDRG